MISRLFFFISFILIATCICAQEKITVAVAANMQYTIREIIKKFNKLSPVKVDVVLGSSGQLTQHVMHGASFDVFISADKEFPQKLFENNFALAPPKVYATGILVLWSARNGITPAKDMKILLQENIKRIAIANPKTAPYGTAAESILKKYGLYKKISSKLVTGESITQTSQFILTQNADIGFTARSIVISEEVKGKGKWVELDQADYPAIEQSAALLKYSAGHSAVAAKKFYDFLFSSEAKVIYRRFGYIVQ